MPDWAELQRDFSVALTDPGSPAPVSPANGDLGRRFDVYRNNRVVSLVDALKAAFPAVCKLVGDRYFAVAARAFIDERPPVSPVLLWYGEGFGEFLESLPSATGVPYLGDVARLEWCRLQALHAADAIAIAIARLAEVPEARIDRVTMTLHPSLSVIASRWPVASLWAAVLKADGTPDVDMGRGEAALVVRPALEVNVQALGNAEGCFIDRLRRGDPLGDAAALATEVDGGFDLAAAIQRLFRADGVVAINVPEPEENL